MSICFSSIAQNLKFDNYTSKDGLISDDVYKMFQDKKGYMWFFTNYGTLKYNGKKFEQVLKNLPFKESFIYSYYENDHGQIWVVNSNSKIYEVKNDSAFLVKGTEHVSELLSLKASEVTDLYVDKSANIYISSKYNGFKLIRKQNYKAISMSDYKDADTVAVYVIETENKVLYSVSLAFRDHRRDFEADSFIVKYINQKNPKENYKLKFPASNRLLGPKHFRRFETDIYFVFYERLLRIKPHCLIKPIQFKSFILDFIQDKNGHLWVGTMNGGLYELNENDSVVNHYLGNETVNHICIDSEDGLWASTEGSGIFHCGNIKEIHFEDSDVFKCGISFIKKIDTRLFIATRAGDMYLLEGNSFIPVKGTENTGLMDIIKFDTGYIIYARMGLHFLEIKNRPVLSKLPIIQPGFYPVNMLKLNSDTILCFSRNRFAILGNGLAGIRGKKMNVNEYLDQKIFCSALRKKEKFVGTHDGVYLFVNNKLVQPSFLALTKGIKIVNIINGNEGTLWFCTEGYGLFTLYSSDKLVQYTTANGLPSNIINNISFDSESHVLLSTNKGLFKSQDLKKWSKMYNGQVRSAYEYNSKVYLAAENKLVIINSKAPGDQSVYFNLASVFLNGKNTTLENIHLLDHNQNNLTFNFDVISYSSGIPDIIYNLQGDKGHWIKVTDQRLVFQNLPPGDYILTARLVSTNIKAKPFIIPFTICKPFWQTGWFILLNILIGFAIVILVGWKLLMSYKKREAKKSEVQQQISEYKLIALKAQINPHFMSNCLMAIQHLIFNNKVDEANEYLAKFSLLVRQVLNFSSKPLVTLKEELEIVAIHIELEQLRFENKFMYEMILSKDIDLQNIFVPPLILQPIIENAIWHGLLPLKKMRKAKLKIEIYTNGDLLYINIEDNGVGRKQIDMTIGNLKESKGIDITRQRIQNLNVYYNKTIADLIYEDLKDEYSNAIGTRVTVILPVNLILNK